MAGWGGSRSTVAFLEQLRHGGSFPDGLAGVDFVKDDSEGIDVALLGHFATGELFG